MKGSTGRDVLVIDDDPWIRVLVERLLSSRGYAVRAVADGAGAMAALHDGFAGVVVLDVNLPDIDGTRLLRQMRLVAPDMPVILLTGQASTDLALDSIRDGAFDFVDKVQLAARLPDAVDHARLQVESAAQSAPFAGIVARSASMRAVFRAVQSALPSRVPVLIRGDSGTGKELIARALHVNGPRRDGPFVAVNCAGIPENLLEAELFGYEKGAFTGATARKLGRFDMARRGTLFLDEIGDMPLALQPKLLRVLQEGEFVRLGGVETLTADVRVVSATHRDLEEAVATGRFREDLYYRLSVYTVNLPPLRDRAGDIPELARHFVRVCAAREGKPVIDLDPRVMELLCSYRFPGNVRELENLLAHAVVAARGALLGIADLPQPFLRAVALERRKPAPLVEPPEAEVEAPRAPPEVRAAPPPAVETGNGKPTVPVRSAPVPTSFPTLREMSRRHVADALRVAAGNKAEAARLLGVSRMTLYRTLKELEEPEP
ncbi:MAG: sigma-54 dependent transcriptional regulator [Pseudomonadota bacterium]|nr:sigma-54 dependent transcriptional regulator [Pseudomonadota bacterium]